MITSATTSFKINIPSSLVNKIYRYHDMDFYVNVELPEDYFPMEKSFLTLYLSILSRYLSWTVVSRDGISSYL